VRELEGWAPDPIFAAHVITSGARIAKAKIEARVSVGIAVGGGRFLRLLVCSFARLLVCSFGAPSDIYHAGSLPARDPLGRMGPVVIGVVCPARSPCLLKARSHATLWPS
jgi:hypothetical protein